ncbi:MAG: hypothetical protein ACXU95_17080 [Isosphaeraceae bacterium]
MTDARPARRRERNSLLASVESFRGLGLPENLNTMILFLYVCENEGLNMSELAYVARLHVATAARLARTIAGEDTAGPGGTGAQPLFEFRAARHDKRLKFVFLTEHGRTLRDHLEEQIATAAPIRA